MCDLRLMVDGKITAREATVPIAVVGEEIAADLGAKTQVVVISGETLNYKKSYHKEINFDLFGKLQEGINGALVFNEVSKTGLKQKKIYFRIGGKPYRLIIRVSAAGEIFLQTLHKITERQFGKGGWWVANSTLSNVRSALSQPQPQYNSFGLKIKPK